MESKIPLRMTELSHVQTELNKARLHKVQLCTEQDELRINKIEYETLLLTQEKTRQRHIHVEKLSIQRVTQAYYNEFHVNTKILEAQLSKKYDKFSDLHEWLDITFSVCHITCNHVYFLPKKFANELRDKMNIYPVFQSLFLFFPVFVTNEPCPFCSLLSKLQKCDRLLVEYSELFDETQASLPKLLTRKLVANPEVFQEPFRSRFIITTKLSNVISQVNKQELNLNKLYEEILRDAETELADIQAEANLTVAACKSKTVLHLHERILLERNLKNLEDCLPYKFASIQQKLEFCYRVVFANYLSSKRIDIMDGINKEFMEYGNITLFEEFSKNFKHSAEDLKEFTQQAEIHVGEISNCKNYDSKLIQLSTLIKQKRKEINVLDQHIATLIVKETQLLRAIRREEDRQKFSNQ